MSVLQKSVKQLLDSPNSVPEDVYSTYQPHSAYLRYLPAEMNERLWDDQTVAVLPDEVSVYRSGRRQRDVLRFLQKRYMMVPIDRNVDPFQCIGRPFLPGSTVVVKGGGTSHVDPPYAFCLEVFSGND
jgi:hypothetical protein